MRGLIDGLETPHPMLAALPAVYHEDDFARRLTQVFDAALAPVIGTLDNLEAYVDPKLTPADFVEWLGGWVAFPVSGGWPPARARQLVARAVELYRWSGTVRGLKELLATYTGSEPEVTDTGGVWWSTVHGSSEHGRAGADGGNPRTKGASKRETAPAKDRVMPPEPHAPHVLVRFRARATRGIDRSQIDALINATKPAHVTCTLEVQG